MRATDDAGGVVRFYGHYEGKGGTTVVDSLRDEIKGDEIKGTKLKDTHKEGTK